MVELLRIYHWRLSKEPHEDGVTHYRHRDHPQELLTVNDGEGTWHHFIQEGIELTLSEQLSLHLAQIHREGRVTEWAGVKPA